MAQRDPTVHRAYWPLKATLVLALDKWTTARFLGTHVAAVDAISAGRNQTSDMGFDTEIEVEVMCRAAAAWRDAGWNVCKLKEIFDTKVATLATLTTDDEFLRVVYRVSDAMRLVSEYCFLVASEVNPWQTTGVFE